MTGDLEKDICCVHTQVTNIFGKVFTLVLVAWPVRGYAILQRQTKLKADKVDLRFELHGYLYGTVY